MDYSNSAITNNGISNCTIIFVVHRLKGKGRMADIPESTNKKLIKRIESDNIILDAAIKVFGKKGYSGTSLTDIAKEAGVTQGLISQRFSGKISVLDAIFGRIPTESLRVGDNAESIEDVFDCVIDKLTETYDTNPDWFHFLYMIYNSSDVPEEFYEAQKRRFDRTQFCKLMNKAQLDGYIPEGELFDYFMVFYQNAFNIIATSRKFRLNIPEKSAFYSIVLLEKIKKEQMREIKRLDSYIDVMTANFDLLCRVDDKLEKYEVIKLVPNHPFIKDLQPGRTFIEHLSKLIDENVFEEDKARIHAALSIEEIDKALDEAVLDVLVFRVVIDGKPAFHQLRISRYIWDDNVKEYLFGFFNIDSGIRAAIAMENKSNQ